MDSHSDKNQHGQQHHHQILPTSTAVAIGAALLVLTVITVWVAHIDLGRWNFLIALLVATIKASLVALFFMNLRWDRRENAVIFSTSFVFLAIFIVLTGTDIFFRGNVYVKNMKEPVPAVAGAHVKAKFTQPWVPTPAIVAHGKELFMVNCIACHGPQGKGDGAAAAGLNPHPRNFTQTADWKNGRKPSQIFKTLKEGLPPSAMASFAFMPEEDRWSLAHYVASLGPNLEKDTTADLAKVGVDPAKGAVAEVEAASISVDFAMERMAAPDLKGGKMEPLVYGGKAMANAMGADSNPGARIYASSCMTCHGMKGEGGVKVQNLGVNPKTYVTTIPLSSAPAAQSPDSFNHVVMNGLPGSMMPGFGQLGGSDLHDLFSYVRSLSQR